MHTVSIEGIYNCTDLNLCPMASEVRRIYEVVAIYNDQGAVTVSDIT